MDNRIVKQINKVKVNNRFFKYPSFDKSKMMTLRMKHPAITSDGDFVLKTHDGAIWKVDLCGKPIWVNTEFSFHHSTEIDDEGNIYVPGTKEGSSERYDHRVMDDFLVVLNSDGEVKFQKSILQILEKNELNNRILTVQRSTVDPIHLNDIQPVLKDGPHWKKGDVFLSLGHLHMVLLYRPSTDQLIWWNQDKMFHQHDIDIVSENEVSIFNNNKIWTFKKGSGKSGEKYTFKHNEILKFNFNEKRYDIYDEDNFKKFDISTITQGLIDFDYQGDYLVEETDYGRLLYFSKKGDLVWEFFNTDDDSKFYSQNWSRLLSKETSDLLRKKIKATKCSN